MGEISIQSNYVKFLFNYWLKDWHAIKKFAITLQLDSMMKAGGIYLCTFLSKMHGFMVRPKEGFGEYLSMCVSETAHRGKSEKQTTIILKLCGGFHSNSTQTKSGIVVNTLVLSFKFGLSV